MWRLRGACAALARLATAANAGQSAANRKIKRSVTKIAKAMRLLRRFNVFFP